MAACTAASVSARLVTSQLDGQQLVRVSQGLGHTMSVPARRDNRVAGSQGRSREIGSHTSASAGDEPSLVVTHEFSLFQAG